MTQRRSAQNDSELIAVVVDHGVFGLELESRYRSRPHAESRRRSLVQQGEKAEVMPYVAWLSVMTEKVHSPAYWDAVMYLEDQIQKLNSAIEKANAPSNAETTLLPVLSPHHDIAVIDEMHDRFDEIKTGIAGLGARMNHTDETLAEVQEMIDKFREHITHLDRTVEDHTSKVGHVTAEMKAITADEQSAFRKNAPTNEFPRPAWGSAQRPARTLVRLPGMAEHRADHEHRAKTVESGDSGDEKER
jgi:methyl-accepting chemotaxis protein